MQFILKKIGTLIITLLLISMAAFLAFQMIPGDPVQSMLGMEATPEQIAAMRESLGLNDPVYVRYVRWLVDFLKGNPGTSYNYQIPVAELLKDKLPVTFALAGITMVFVLLLSIPFGIFISAIADRKAGRFFNIINQVIMAIPSFFLGVLLILFFGLVLKWFTPGKYISYTESVSGFLLYMTAPAAAIAIPKAAMVIRFLKSSVLDQMKNDYVRTAYSKGNNDKRVLYIHILKNACIPVITILGMIAADTLAGSIVVEQVFNLPGMGRLLVASIGNRDYPVVQAIVVYIAFAVVTINCFVDILYRFADPRIRMEA